MRSARVLLTTIALAALALTGASACTAAAANSAGVWVRVSPATIAPGSAVGIQASCGDDLNPATVSSTIFGSVTLQPANNLLATTVNVPATAVAGTYNVALVCHTGSKAQTTLTVLKGGGTVAPAAVGPHTGGGFLANGADGPARGPLISLGLGLAALLGAFGLSLRNKKRRRRAAEERSVPAAAIWATPATELAVRSKARTAQDQPPPTHR